jgi:hypothetical protein
MLETETQRKEVNSGLLYSSCSFLFGFKSLDRARITHNVPHGKLNRGTSVVDSVEGRGLTESDSWGNYQISNDARDGASVDLSESVSKTVEFQRWHRTARFKKEHTQHRTDASNRHANFQHRGGKCQDGTEIERKTPMWEFPANSLEKA